MNLSRKALCFIFIAFLFLAVAHSNVNAQPIASFTLNFDWERDFTFNQTTVYLYADGTFISGTGATGLWEILSVAGIPAISLSYTSGCKPLYGGHFFGYMKCTDGAMGDDRPGYWYISASTDLDESATDSRPDSPNPE